MPPGQSWSSDVRRMVLRALLIMQCGLWQLWCPVSLLSHESHMQEDELLRQLVDKYGPKKWSIISTFLPGKGGKQVRGARGKMRCSLLRLVRQHNRRGPFNCAKRAVPSTLEELSKR
jgi:hypothetical protein